ncbi:MAG: hypothetical protein OER88_12915 [Planctomycetota bacterium]|nr:hypothetical protein [Planctomycetota bacterium]
MKNADRAPFPRARRRTWIAPVAILCLLAAGEVWAQRDRAEPEKKQTESQDQAATDSKKKKSAIAQAVTRERGRKPARVFTNEDLEKLTGLGPEQPRIKPPSPDAPPPPKKKTAAEKAAEDGRAPGFADTERRAARAADLDRRRSAAEARVLLAEQRVSALERRLLQIRNPYLARPEIPEDEKEAWDALDGAGRAALTERQLAGAKKDLAEAREAYEAARRGR